MRLNVLLVSYNVSKYIEECVGSILMQKTDFEFNVVILQCGYNDPQIYINLTKQLEKPKEIAFF